MKKFKKIYIEITNVCNLHCDFCPQTQRKPEFMNIDLFSKILDQIKSHTEYIYLHVKGEPLLHPELHKLLDLAYEKGFKVNITTNGTRINKVKAMLLRKPALRQINFSLHSFDGNEGFQNEAAQYIEDQNEGDQNKEAQKIEGQNKTDHNKEDYLYNILSFTKEALLLSDMIIGLRFWNYEEDNLINMEKAVNNKMLLAIKNEFNLDYEIQEKVLPGKGFKIKDRLYLNQDHKFQWPDFKEEEDDGKGFCYGLRNQVAILVDGTVVPCCLDGEGAIALGNVNKAHFSDIIMSERACSIVDGFSRREAVEELCRKCGYRKRFG